MEASMKICRLCGKSFLSYTIVDGKTVKGLSKRKCCYGCVPLGQKDHKHTNIDINIFLTVVKNSLTIREALLKMGLCGSGSNQYVWFKKMVKLWNVDISHFQPYAHSEKNGSNKKRPLEDILIKNSPYISTRHLKVRLVKEGVFEDKCYACGISKSYNGLPIVMQLHHKNGDRGDNRKENLTLLCPNCHTQTENYGSRKSHASLA